MIPGIRIRGLEPDYILWEYNINSTEWGYLFALSSNLNSCILLISGDKRFSLNKYDEINVEMEG